MDRALLNICSVIRGHMRIDRGTALDTKFDYVTYENGQGTDLYM